MAVHVVYNNDMNCQTCDNVLRAERGCDQKGKVPFRIDGEIYYRCPLRLITPLSWEYLTAYNLYQKGILPHGEGWANEVQKFIDAMLLIENEIALIDKEELKKKGAK